MLSMQSDSAKAKVFSLVTAATLVVKSEGLALIPAIATIEAPTTPVAAKSNVFFIIDSPKTANILIKCVCQAHNKGVVVIRWLE